METFFVFAVKPISARNVVVCVLRVTVIIPTRLSAGWRRALFAAVAKYESCVHVRGGSVVTTDTRIRISDRPHPHSFYHGKVISHESRLLLCVASLNIIFKYDYFIIDKCEQCG